MLSSYALYYITYGKNLKGRIPVKLHLDKNRSEYLFIIHVFKKIRQYYYRINEKISFIKIFHR